MNQQNYTERKADGSFPDFIKQFGTVSPDNNEVIIQPSSGKGSIRYIDIEPGLQLRLWDCTFTHGLTINRQPTNKGDHRSFTLACYLTTYGYQLHDCHNSPAVIDEIWDTVLMSSDASFRAEILPGKGLRCISIKFSSEWLQRNIGLGNGFSTTLLQRISVFSDPFVIFESLSVVERELANSFFYEENPKTFGKFFWRSKVLSMLTHFLSKSLNRLSARNGCDSDHEEQMAEVEKQLVANLHNGLPELKDLAKNIAVSESTLKRYFRRIYGKNIYNYYLEKRMACARHLLLEKNKTVSETASIMGYENISHFISTFKKYYGTLPGALRKEYPPTG